METKSTHREEMFSLIEKWQQSGVSQKAWCGQNNIRYHIFHYWYKRYRRQTGEATGNVPSFIQLQVKDTGNQPLMELLMNNGKRLVFYHQVSSEFLKALIA